jgi:hypothetical protein
MLKNLISENIIFLSHFGLEKKEKLYMMLPFFILYMLISCGNFFSLSSKVGTFKNSFNKTISLIIYHYCDMNK